MPRASPLTPYLDQDNSDIATLAALAIINNPKDTLFKSTIFSRLDFYNIRLLSILDYHIFRLYIRLIRSIIYIDIDIIIFIYLLLYLFIIILNTAFLFQYFIQAYNLLYFTIQISYIDTYILIIYQYIYIQGILKRQFRLFNILFPYIINPLIGYIQNLYYYYYIKYYYIKDNRLYNLLLIIQYQYNNIFHFLYYIIRFFFFIWLNLPLYFIRKRKASLITKAAFWELI